jgi:hypothetical protein
MPLCSTKAARCRRSRTLDRNRHLANFFEDDLVVIVVTTNLQKNIFTKMSDSDSEQTGVPLIEDVSDSDAPETSNATKRKRGNENENDAPTESKRAAKRRRNPKKPKDVQDDALDEEKGVNNAIAHMDSSLMADHIAQRTKRFKPDLSLVEAEDLHVPCK